MKYVYPLILIMLLANFALSAQVPPNIFPFEDVKNPFSHMVQPYYSSAKTFGDKNLLIAYKADLNYVTTWFGIDSIKYYHDDNQNLISEIDFLSVNQVLTNYFKYNYEYDQLSINLEGLSNGTYYLELSDENTRIQQTLMLVR